MIIPAGSLRFWCLAPSCTLSLKNEFLSFCILFSEYHNCKCVVGSLHGYNIYEVAKNPFVVNVGLLVA
uniref:Uncharacterized protein n=1 Tax=Rhizophora mucronata TaxID=61149 RepID=A0A2P2KPX6_RHIMU